MRSRSLAFVLLVLGLSRPALAAEDVARAALSVSAQFGARTSLRVSSELLRFDVTDPAGAVSVAIEFSAGARTAANDDVVLSVEPLHGVEGPGGAADVATDLRVDAVGDLAQRVRVESAQTTVVGKWRGSGLRRGHLVFTLTAPVRGSYLVPVRFVLSAP